MIQLKVKVPDHLKNIFDDRDFVEVGAQGLEAKQALLLWLWAKGEGIWVSRHPNAARRLLDDALMMYPKLPKTRVEFAAPRDLGFKDYDHAVIDQPATMPDVVAWSREHVLKQVRVLEPTNTTATSSVDRLGLSLEDRLSFLNDARAGINIDYDELDLVRSVCASSLYVFLKEFWSEVVPESFLDNWHIKYLCDELQVVAERVMRNEAKKYNLVVNIMPGSTKSMIASVMLPAWCWTRMASLRFIGGSYAKQLAMDLSRKNRQLIKSTKFQRCWSTKMKDDQDSKSFFMNETGGMRLGIGTGGIAGFHAHLIVIDDPLDPNKAVSEIELDAANKWITDSLSNRKVDQTITPTILIMQRLHENDPTGAMLNRSDVDEVKHICIPAEVSENVKPRELVKHYVDGLMDPQRMPRTTLASKQRLGMYMYSGQYQQSPTPPSGGMFKWERIAVEKSAPTKFTRIIRYWDKAATEGGGCYTAGVKLGLEKDGRIWILHVKRGQWDSARREAIIKQTTELDGLECIVGIEQEGGSGGLDSARATVRNLRGYRVRCDKPTGNKVLRADPFSTSVNNGEVSIVNAGWVAGYLDELKHFPLGKFKDQVDASTGAYKLLIKKPIRVGGGWGCKTKS